MVVADVMTSRLWVVGELHTVNVAARRMRENGLRALPVLLDGRLTGIVTARDLAQRVTARGLPPWSTYVRQVMTPAPVTCRPDEPLEAALERMRARHVQRLVVLDAEQRLVGTIDADRLLANEPTRELTRCVLGRPAPGCEPPVVDARGRRG